jgi:hypothetical protein
LTFLRKPTQAFAVLFVLLLSMILILPQGMDLELCFGTDGHIDFSLNGCQDGVSTKIPASEQPHRYGSIHPDDCRHMALACGTAQERIRTAGNTHSYKSRPKKDPSKSFLPFTNMLADSAGAYLHSDVYSSIPFEDCPSPHLVSLRTTVLLI